MMATITDAPTRNRYNRTRPARLNTALEYSVHRTNGQIAAKTIALCKTTIRLRCNIRRMWKTIGICDDLMRFPAPTRVREASPSTDEIKVHVMMLAVKYGR